MNDQRAKTWNDLVYAIAARAQELADKKMHDLRGAAGFGCSSEYEAQQKAKGDSRGDLICEILCEEFIVEDHLNPDFEE